MRFSVSCNAFPQVNRLNCHYLAGNYCYSFKNMQFTRFGLNGSYTSTISIDRIKTLKLLSISTNGIDSVKSAKLRAFEIDSGCCVRSHAKDITKYCELHFIKIYWTMWLQEKTRRKRIVNVKTLRELKLLTWKTRLHMQNVLIRKRISFTHSQTANAA